MAAVTVPSGRSLLGKLRDARAARGDAKPGKASPLAALAARAREHVVTVAALASADFSAFQVNIPHLGAAPGLAMTCLSLLPLDFAVRG